MPLTPLDANTLRDAIAGVMPLRLALVFGSVARGTARGSSDIDLAVWAAQPLTSDEKIRLIEAIAQATGRAVDLIDLARAGQPLTGEILRDGVRLIGSADTQADLATRAVFEAADFLPYVRRMLKQRRQAWIA